MTTNLKNIAIVGVGHFHTTRAYFYSLTDPRPPAMLEGS
jgi:hypothetical protein